MFRAAEFPTIAPCDALLILPPFAGIDRPSLGLHVLQAFANRAGFKVRILYANLLLAAEIGNELYTGISYGPTSDLLGERMFSNAAGFTARADVTKSPIRTFRTAARYEPLLDHSVSITQLQAYAGQWLERIVSELSRIETPVVGLNSTFEQTSSSIAIIDQVKLARPDLTTVMGGANCEGQMGQGVISLTPHLDYVFSGESEFTFVEFLESVRFGKLPSAKIITGTPLKEMDSLPLVDFSDFYEQRDALEQAERISGTEHVWLPYESSRGCWWGQKHHCTFCGINGQGMGFREKSAEKVIAELDQLLGRHPSNKVLMVDNIMPSSYFKTLLPQLERSGRNRHIFYEQKANLTLAKVEALRRAGVVIIQPGIEALSTGLLALMKKGVKARQNIALLRYARACDLAVNWNLLYAFPGDEEKFYEETLELLPKIRHLSPPTGVCHLSIDRFSPYFDRSDEFGITNLRPMEAYSDVFPEWIDKAQLAYHFIGDYDCAFRRNPETIQAIQDYVVDWRDTWSGAEPVPPSLAIERIGGGSYLLADTRSGCSFQFINEEQARVALKLSRVDELSVGLREWAIHESNVAVEIDNMIVPLATARPELIEEFETSHSLDLQEDTSGAIHKSW